MSTCASAASSSAVGISSGGGEALISSSVIVVQEAVTESHVVHIRGYSRTKGHGSGRYIKSSTFSAGGHRWFIRFYPDGGDTDSAGWISIFLQLDHTDAAVDDAAVAVKARFRFGVLDCSGEPVPTFSLDSSVADTFSSKVPMWGFSQFIKREALEDEESSSCLRDDCLKVRCDVTVYKAMSTEATAQFVVVPPSNMHRQLGSLLSAGAVGADVEFEVAGEMVAAHRCVLAARSPVFMAELFGPMKEKDAMNTIRIEDMEAVVFRAMLQFIYSDTVPDIDKEDAFVISQHLLVAADRYDLERLKLICEDRLCKCIDTSTVTTTLELAERHGCHGLKKACLEFLKSPSHLNTVMATESFDHLMITCPSLIKELLAKVATCA